MVDWGRIDLEKQLHILVGRIWSSKIRRIATELRRQASSQDCVNSGAVTAMFILFQEEHDSRTPVVIGGHLVVEAQDFRAGTDQRRTVPEGGERAMEQWLHRFAKEHSAELEA
jgi:hypothetical protein